MYSVMHAQTGRHKLESFATSLQFADGYGANATFNRPSGVTLFNNNTLIIADTNNNRIRKMNISTGILFC